MKKLLAFLSIIILLTSSSTHNYGGAPDNGGSEPNDSMLPVIGWFGNRDSLVYLIQDSSWEIQPGDSTLTAGVSTRVQLSVTDSTAEGYNMDYTFLQFDCASVPNNKAEELTNNITQILSNKLIGKTISFETDECGQILKFHDEAKLKKQAKSLFKDGFKEIEKLPWYKEFKKQGVSIKDFTKNIDSDYMVNKYLEDIRLLFMLHGNAFKRGVRAYHEEATDSTYEKISQHEVIEEEDGSYRIIFFSRTFIPSNNLKEQVSNMVENTGNNLIKESFKNNYIEPLGCVVESTLQFEYLSCGYPYAILKKESVTIGNKTRLKQKNIHIARFSYDNH